MQYIPYFEMTSFFFLGMCLLFHFYGKDVGDTQSKLYWLLVIVV